jgi:small subunit ribosomal protein S6
MNLVFVFRSLLYILHVAYFCFVYNFLLMARYEMMCILNPSLNDAELASLSKQIVDEIGATGATYTHSDDWGKRDMAYRINGSREGYYVLYYFDAESVVFQSLTLFLNLTKDTWRHMIVRYDEVSTPTPSV